MSRRKALKGWLALPKHTKMAGQGDYVKEVPATIPSPPGWTPGPKDRLHENGKLIIGTAYIYADGEVRVDLDADIPDWAKKTIEFEAAATGFSIGGTA